jgi:hypothetical protein
MKLISTMNRKYSHTAYGDRVEVTVITGFVVLYRLAHRLHLNIGIL